MKRAVVIASLAVLALAGCGDAGKQDNLKETIEKAGASSGPDAPSGLSVSDGVLVLPVVKGRPGVAYFALSNAGEKPTSLAAVFIDGVGKTEMHETKGGKMAPMNWVQVEAGQTVRFERGGKHVMLFDVGDTLKAGGAAEMTLTFSGGDKLSTPLRIEAAGGGM